METSTCEWEGSMSLQCLRLGSDNEQEGVLSAGRIVGTVLERYVWWLCSPGGL